MRNIEHQAKGAAWKAAEAERYDRSLIGSNLRKTPYERMQQHSRALTTARMPRKAMEERSDSASCNQGGRK